MESWSVSIFTSPPPSNLGPAGTGRQLTASNIPNILLHRALRLYWGVGNSANKCGLRSERTGKMSKLCPIFFWSFALTKRFDFKIPQLFWKDFVLWSLKIISFWSKQNKLFCNFHCFLRPIGDFWVTFEVGIESSSQWSGVKKIKVVNCKFYNQITNHVTVLISEQFLESRLDLLQNWQNVMYKQTSKQTNKQKLKFFISTTRFWTTSQQWSGFVLYISQKENGPIMIPKTVLKSGLWRGQ